MDHTRVIVRAMVMYPFKWIIDNKRNVIKKKRSYPRLTWLDSRERHLTLIRRN